MSKHNIFVSYKFGDENVKRLPGRKVYEKTTARDYVDIIENMCTQQDIGFYRGEHNNEDLSHLSGDAIWERLKDRIYSTSVTIVLITPNMNDRWKPEDKQWIPHEISYSLREQTRNDRKSHKNALLFVVIPDQNNNTYHALRESFRIIKVNRECGYAEQVMWDQFIHNPQKCIERALQRSVKTDCFSKI